MSTAPLAATTQSDAPLQAKDEAVSTGDTEGFWESLLTDALGVPGAAAPAAISVSDRESFLPRSRLSVPARPTAPVVLAAPPLGMEPVRYLGILSLYIDEHGQVQQIEADEPFLPTRLEQIARDAFMAVQFSPALVDGRPVKSRQRVEVVFDNTPIAIR